ncbi:uncharacterized protein LOC126566019 [Anopheles maculipalpis]|uniref:uncharacterized protein LOC126566019 n=1 Tax=Anopheles maculipalpis TaxID=1496333 RepID=UPI002158DC08|nr:uncharacterized protein LOC126566019 [Anopheles maculipalpis]
MAPRKKTTKVPAKPTNPPARRESAELPPEPSRRNERNSNFRSLKTVDELRSVMGVESEDSHSNSENESLRSNTNQSRPNFSFLPSHKHSSPNTVKRTISGPSTTAHRLTSMPTVPNTDLEHQDSSAASTNAPTPKSGSRKSTRSVANSEASTSSEASQRAEPEPQPSTSQQHSHSRKQQTPGQLKLLKEIIRLQSTVDNLIPKMCFARVIREILAEYAHRPLRVSPDMLFCLQEAAEIYLVQLFEDSYRCTIHRGRVTLIPKDMRLACALRRDN